MSQGFAVTIVGAGVVGCAVAWELAKAGQEVLVLDKSPGVSQGENQSSRNSGVIHAGLYYDQETRPLKAALCVEGNELLYPFCQRYGVPAIKCGKLVVATQESELPVLERYLARAHENEVPASLLSEPEAREREPRVNAVGALLLPSSGIIDAAALVHKLYALASGAGAQFVSQTEVVGVVPATDGLEIEVQYRDEARDSFFSGRLVNCGGLYSDQVARLVDPGSPYRVDPLRGEAMKFYRGKRPEVEMAGMNVYPTPKKISTDQGTYFTVGVHLTPTLETGPQGSFGLGPVVTVGPLNRQARDREDYGGDFRPAADFFEQVTDFFPGLRVDDLEPHQVGIQAHLVDYPDFVMEFSPAQPRCFNLLGIDSPGLTSSLALARRARAMLLE